MINLLQQDLHIKNVRLNAVSLNASMDSAMNPKITNLKDKYVKHMEYCINNPTTGLIARQEFIINPVKKFPGHYIANSYHINDSKEGKYLQNILNERIENLYPKTKKIRDYIIKDNRLSLNYRKEIRGYNLLDALKIFLKR